MAKKKNNIIRKSRGVVSKELYEQYITKYEKASKKLTKISKGEAKMFRQVAKWTRDDADNQFYLEYLRARNDLIEELRERGNSTVGVNSQVIIRRMVRQATTPVSESQALRQSQFFTERNWKLPVRVPVSTYSFSEDDTEDVKIMIKAAKESGQEFIELDRAPTAEDFLFGRVDLENLKPLSRDDKRLSDLYHELLNEGYTRAKAGEYISYYVYGSD